MRSGPNDGVKGFCEAGSDGTEMATEELGTLPEAVPWLGAVAGATGVAGAGSANARERQPMLRKAATTMRCIIDKYPLHYIYSTGMWFSRGFWSLQPALQAPSYDRRREDYRDRESLH